MKSATEKEQTTVDTGGADGEKGRTGIDVLRRFHHGEPHASAATSKPAATILPALLNPYRDASAIRYQYPLYLLPPGTATASKLATPLAEFLSSSLQALAPSTDDARILKDNLPWVERYLRQQLDEADPVDARETFAQAAAALQAHLDLQTDSRKSLDADIGRLLDSIEENAQLLGYGARVSLHLMVHTVRHRRGPNNERFQQKLKQHIGDLQSLLDVDRAKSAGADEPENVKSSVGPASRYFDAGALSGMLEQRPRGSTAMSAERRARVERALAELQAWQRDSALVQFVGSLDDPWFEDQTEIELVDSEDPCATAAEIFERDASKFARVFAAARVAVLEIDAAYNPSVHDSWFDSFDWQAFSAEEMQLVTPVVALVSADYLAGDGLPSFSRLLGSRQPVHVLSWVRAYDNPGAKAGEDPFNAYRFELAYFGIGHRQVVVAQTSAARHEDLLSGFLCALDSNRASLHLINRGTQTMTSKPLLDAWFVASAALESRAHPFVLVNPDAGDHAAERVSFGGNPQADKDWPVEKLEYRSDNGETTEMDLAFTFADYALLMPALHSHFRSVPADLQSDELLAIDQYLQMEESLVDRLIPYVWGIDDAGMLTRLVVSRALVFACRDRLNYWRTLQELAGIHNFYVEEAIDRVIKEQQAAIEAERKEIAKAHEEHLESVRTEAAGEVMGQLVDVLMGADLSDMISDSTPLASMPATEPPVTESPPAPTEPEEAKVEEEEDEVSFDEPWLDTAMCTTCDDCMGVNKMMFAYNDNKQAIIRDPRAGSYADLVKAAEICPAKCIHPGKPLDPNEPGLDELIARAAPFN